MMQFDKRGPMSVANAKHTVLNPVIPYTGPIPGGLHPGEIIIIQGTVPPDADSFQVDLSSGCSTKPRSDVAFHFRPRFDDSPCVVCNSLLRESWGEEETLHQLPYKRGAPFETIILVHKDGFKVAVNGTHLLEYKHRISPNVVDTFSISGSVRVHAIGYIPNSAIYSESGDLSVPYKGSILKGLSPGQHITIKGQVSLYPHSFTINLCNSKTENIALHLNPRMKSSVFIRNSYLDESWGQEERELLYFPFSSGEYFEAGLSHSSTPTWMFLNVPSLSSIAVNDTQNKTSVLFFTSGSTIIHRTPAATLNTARAIAIKQTSSAEKAH